MTIEAKTENIYDADSHQNFFSKGREEASFDVDGAQVTLKDHFGYVVLEPRTDTNQHFRISGQTESTELQSKNGKPRMIVHLMDGQPLTVMVGQVTRMTINRTKNQ